jgi:PST family polysaccharide transporter
LDAIQVKFFLAIKFFVLVRLLSPQVFGDVLFISSIIVLIDGLTDTGLIAGFIKYREDYNTKVPFTIWMLNLFRSLLSSLILVVLAVLTYNDILDYDYQTFLFAALIPIIKALINFEYYGLIKKLQFKDLFIINIIASIFECFLLFIFVYYDFGARSVVFAIIFTEIGKMVFSYYTFGFGFISSYSYDSVRPLIGFSRWLWFQNVVSGIVSQFDKFYIASSMGMSLFAAYQSTSRLPQFIIADFSSIWGGYIFPRNSNINDSKYISLFKGNNLYVIISSGLLCILTVLFSKSFILLFLGLKYLKYDLIFKVHAVTMFFGSIIAINVGLLKSRGNSRIIALTALLQLFIIVVYARNFLGVHGIIGMAIVNCCSIFITALILTLYSLKWKID